MKEAYETQIENINNEINKNEIELNYINSYNTNIEIVSKNKALINTKKGIIEQNNRTVNNLYTEKGSIENILSQTNENKKSYENLLITIKKEIKKSKIWKYYIEMLKPKGISSIVLSNVLPTINDKLNNTLDGLCNFKVNIATVDNDEDINKNEKPYNLLFLLIDANGNKRFCSSGSGFEQTLCALALRHALSSFSSINRPSFLVLDEVEGPISPDNFENLRDFYYRILNDYDYILHITHKKEFESWHNQIITITKENGISKNPIIK